MDKSADMALPSAWPDTRKPGSELLGDKDSNHSSHVNVGLVERALSTAAGSALAYYGVRLLFERRFDMASLGATFLGTFLMARGATGYCPVNALTGRDSAYGADDKALKIVRSVTILKPRQEVYDFWRKLENLPKFMHHLSEVRELDGRRSHWAAAIANTDKTLEWDAEITHEVPGSELAWQSLPGADIENAGRVAFTDAPGGRGTEVHAAIEYHPPAGALGRMAAKLMSPAFKQMVKEDLRRFKMLMETGEVPRLEPVPKARKSEPLSAQLTRHI